MGAQRRRSLKLVKVVNRYRLALIGLFRNSQPRNLGKKKWERRRSRRQLDCGLSLVSLVPPRLAPFPLEIPSGYPPMPPYPSPLRRSCPAFRLAGPHLVPVLHLNGLERCPGDFAHEQSTRRPKSLAHCVHDGQLHSGKRSAPLRSDLSLSLPCLSGHLNARSGFLFQLRNGNCVLLR